MADCVRVALACDKAAMCRVRANCEDVHGTSGHGILRVLTDLGLAKAQNDVRLRDAGLLDLSGDAGLGVVFLDLRMGSRLQVDSEEVEMCTRHHQQVASVWGEGEGLDVIVHRVFGQPRQPGRVADVQAEQVEATATANSEQGGLGMQGRSFDWVVKAFRWREGLTVVAVTDDHRMIPGSADKKASVGGEGKARDVAFVRVGDF